MKTLVVQFLPRGECSKTKALLDFFLSSLPKNAKVENLDLLQNPPDFFLKDNVLAYYERNYGGQTLSEEKTKLLKKMDEMTNQFVEADIVVLVYPMYNFSFPAIVKAWFDSVMLKGETWDIGKNGYEGLLTKKKALILSTCGGVYNKEFGNESMDHSTTLGALEFSFMGIPEVKVISAQGINMMPEKTDEILQNAKKEISGIVEKWY